MRSPVLTATMTDQGVERLTVSYVRGGKAAGLELARRFINTIPTVDDAVRRATAAPEDPLASSIAV